MSSIMGTISQGRSSQRSEQTSLSQTGKTKCNWAGDISRQVYWLYDIRYIFGLFKNINKFSLLIGNPDIHQQSH